MSAIRLLSGGNRTWRGRPNSVEIDPKETFPRTCRFGFPIYALGLCGLESMRHHEPRVVFSSRRLEAGQQPMSDISFETALGERVEDMLDACTRCGKCVEVCPSVKPAGISDTKSEDIISGVLDLVRTGVAPEASRKWAASCMLSGVRGGDKVFHWSGGVSHWLCRILAPHRLKAAS